MFRALPVFLFSLFTNFPVFSQSNIVLRGEVRDSVSGEALPYAHIGICGKAIGTVSSETGEFQLNLAPYLLNDTLCVSSIGYETFKVPVKDLAGKKIIPVYLIIHPGILNEIIVSDDRITARRLISNAVARIEKNCPNKPFVIEGYYRDYLKKEDDYISFLESALTIQDPGINKPDSKTKVRVNQVRFNKSYIQNFRKYCKKDESDTIKEIMEGFSPFVNGNEFTNMKSNNPIRNHSTEIPIVGLFDQFYMSNLKFEIAYNINVDGRRVYVIHFEPSEMFKYHYVQVVGEVYIREDDYAILKFEYKYFLSLFREKKKLYELNVEYREYQGKMFLNYISFVNYFKIYTGDEIAELYQYREFFVNDIHFPKFEPIREKEVLDDTIPFHEYGMESDPDFWNNYNAVLLEKPFKN
jgi:hypothetical protein